MLPGQFHTYTFSIIRALRPAFVPCIMKSRKPEKHGKGCFSAVEKCLFEFNNRLQKHEGRRVALSSFSCKMNLRKRLEE
jgi:hypothetical protein